MMGVGVVWVYTRVCVWCVYVCVHACTYMNIIALGQLVTCISVWQMCTHSCMHV